MSGFSSGSSASSSSAQSPFSFSNPPSFSFGSSASPFGSSAPATTSTIGFFIGSSAFGASTPSNPSSSPSPFSFSPNSTFTPSSSPTPSFGFAPIATTITTSSAYTPSFGFVPSSTNTTTSSASAPSFGFSSAASAATTTTTTSSASAPSFGYSFGSTASPFESSTPATTSTIGSSAFGASTPSNPSSYPSPFSLSLNSTFTPSNPSSSPSPFSFSLNSTFTPSSSPTPSFGFAPTATTTTTSSAYTPSLGFVPSSTNTTTSSASAPSFGFSSAASPASATTTTSSASAPSLLFSSATSSGLSQFGSSASTTSTPLFGSTPSQSLFCSSSSAPTSTAYASPLFGSHSSATLSPFGATSFAPSAPTPLFGTSSTSASQLFGTASSAPSAPSPLFGTASSSQPSSSVAPTTQSFQGFSTSSSAFTLTTSSPLLKPTTSTPTTAAPPSTTASRFSAFGTPASSASQSSFGFYTSFSNAASKPTSQSFPTPSAPFLSTHTTTTPSSTPATSTKTQASFTMPAEEEAVAPEAVCSRSRRRRSSLRLHVPSIRSFFLDKKPAEEEAVAPEAVWKEKEPPSVPALGVGASAPVTATTTNTSTAATQTSTSPVAASTSCTVFSRTTRTTSNVSTTVSTAPRLPSEITGKTLEEIIEEWNAELQENWIGDETYELVHIQANNIAKHLPDIVKKINDRLNFCIMELNKMPKSLLSVAEAMTAFMQIIGLAKESLRKILLRGEFEEYAEDNRMHCTARLVEMLNQYSDELHRCPESDAKSNFLMEEIKILEENKGISLPNFLPRNAFHIILQRKVNGISSIPIAFVEQVWIYIEEAVISVLMRNSENYYQLQLSARRAGHNLMAKMKEGSIKWMLELVEMEKLTDYTCDADYVSEWNKLMASSNQFIHGVLADENKPSIIAIEGIGEIEVGVLRKYPHVLAQAYDLKMRMTAYWKVVLRRFVDFMALHLQLSVNNLVNKEMEAEIVNELMGPYGGGIERMLEESPAVAVKREKLNKSIKKLRDSKEVVAKIMDSIITYGD